MFSNWAGTIFPTDLETDVVAGFNGLLAQNIGRDRVTFGFVFLTRGVAGFASLANPKKGGVLAELEDRARLVSGELGKVRRAHLFFREIPIIQSIPASFAIKDTCCKVLDVAAKVFLSGYCIFDHLATLKFYKCLPGGNDKALQTMLFGYKLYVYSMLSTILQNLKMLWNEKDSKDDEAPKRRFEAKKTIVKCFLLFVEYAHLTSQLKTHDAFVGVLGALSGIYDCAYIWPKRKVTLPKALEVPSTPAKDTIITCDTQEPDGEISPDAKRKARPWPADAKTK